MRLQDITTDELHQIIGILRSVSSPSKMQQRILSLLQIDLANRELFNIRYIEEDGTIVYYTEEEYMIMLNQLDIKKE